MCLGVGENCGQIHAMVKKDDPLIEHAQFSCTVYVEIFFSVDKIYIFGVH